MALADDFKAAIDRVNGLPSSPSNDVKLKLYGLYKQATAGDVKGSKPGRLDIAGRAKFEAWEGRKGMSKDDAMTAYIALADELAG